MKENYTHIAVVLDRSGSMNNVKDDTIGGFNQFLEDQKKEEGEATLTLAQFDNQYELLEEFTDIGEVALLDDKTFVPRGRTALRDAIGRTITTVGADLAKMDEADRPSKVVVVVLTDGHENASREFSGDDIKALVEQQQNDYKWEFVFIGANQDAVLVGGSLGFDRGKSVTYASTSVGTHKAFGMLGDKMSAHRAYKGAGGASLNYMDFDREQLLDPENKPLKPSRKGAK